MPGLGGRDSPQKEQRQARRGTVLSTGPAAVVLGVLGLSERTGRAGLAREAGRGLGAGAPGRLERAAWAGGARDARWPRTSAWGPPQRATVWPRTTRDAAHLTEVKRGPRGLSAAERGWGWSRHVGAAGRTACRRQRWGRVSPRCPGRPDGSRHGWVARLHSQGTRLPAWRQSGRVWGRPWSPGQRSRGRAPRARGRGLGSPVSSPDLL